MFAITVLRHSAKRSTIHLLMVVAMLFVQGTFAWADAKQQSQSYSAVENQSAEIVPISAFSWSKAGRALLPAQPAYHPEKTLFNFVLFHSSTEIANPPIFGELSETPLFLTYICIKGMHPCILAPPVILL